MWNALRAGTRGGSNFMPTLARRSFTLKPQSNKHLESRVHKLEHTLKAHRRRIRAINTRSRRNLSRIKRNQRSVAEMREIDERRLWDPDTVESVHQHLLSIERRVTMTNLRYGEKFFNKWTAAGVAALILGVVIYKQQIYNAIGEETAKMAQKTLEQERLITTVVDTIDKVCQDPETLATLANLVKRLLQDPSTQQELVKLLIWAFQQKDVQKSLLWLAQIVFTDPNTQRLAGEFEVCALRQPQVQKMIAHMTADLITRTLLDEKVQKAAGEGIYRSIGHAVTPRVMTPDWWSNSDCDTDDSPDTKSDSD